MPDSSSFLSRFPRGKDLVSCSWCVNMSSCGPLTREALHIQVRKLCLQHKISLKAKGPDFRRMAEQSLMELLKVKILTLEHKNVLDYFCTKVPAFYKKCKGNLRSVRTNHKDFFSQPLFKSSEEADIK